MHIDATYKVIHNGYPLIVCGVSDRKRKFHPVAFQLLVNESEEDYEFIYNSVNLEPTL